MVGRAWALGVSACALLAGCKDGREPAAQAEPTVDEPAVAAAEVPADHPVWALAPNRHMAHLTVGGDLVVDAGAPGFARYRRFGIRKTRWRLGVVVDRASTAELVRGGSPLELPLTAAQAASARALELRVHARKAGTLRVHGGAKVEVVRGWQVVRLPHRWHEGENELMLESSLGDDLHVAWLRVASRDEPTGGDPRALVRWDDGTLRLDPGAGLAWYVTVPERAALAADVAAGCAAEVDVRDGDGAHAAGRLDGDGARFDLGEFAGRVVRLEVRAGDCEATLAGAGVVVAGDPPAPPPDGAPPKYVVFWVMDALRADRIPAFEPGARAETPNFDALAATGAVFRRHYVGGIESQGSHSSMFTGLYPAVHTVQTAGNDINFLIPKRFTTLGQQMSAAGYYTIGVTGNGFVGKDGGYARGFREYRNLMKEKGVRNGIIPGMQMVDIATRRLEKARDGNDRVFVFIGTIDTHSPYLAHPPWVARYDEPGYRGEMQEASVASVLGIVRGRMGCHKVPPQREITRLRALYDGNISYQDKLLGEMVARLEAMGIRDETMIVVTADHGEELFEETRCGHGKSLRESLTHVPLLVHYPPRIAAGTVEVGSEGIDVLPTILDTIGAEVPPQVQGATLRTLPAEWARPSFASQFEYSFAVRLGDWKLRVLRDGTILVHDLGDDPLERHNQAARRPLERRYLTDHLGLYVSQRRRWKKDRWGLVSNMTEAAAAEL